MKVSVLFGFALFSVLCSLTHAQNEMAVWIDTDMGNDFDDELAISYALKASDLLIEGISTTHWRHEGACDMATADSSAVLVRELIEHFSGRQARVLKGAEQKFANVYGEIDCHASATVKYLISVARAHSPERPLHVIGLGAATNIASAICWAPDIKANIRVYILGAKYDAMSEVWDKNEFNVQNDLSAFDYLLNARDLDLSILPANVGAELQFSKEWLKAETTNGENLSSYLRNRWNQLDSIRTTWTAYDLALVMAIAQPQWVGWSQVRKPPENGFGNVRVATYLDNSAMEQHLSELWSGDGE